MGPRPFFIPLALMPQSLLSFLTFIEDLETTTTAIRNRRRGSRFLEIVGQLVAPPRYIRIDVSFADTTTTHEWDFYPLE